MDTKETYKLLLDDTLYETSVPAKFLRRKKYQKTDPKKIMSVIPGVISEIHIKAGQQLKEGDPMLILEAMKMKNDVVSPYTGKVKSINVKVGQMVPKNYLLIEFE